MQSRILISTLLFAACAAAQSEQTEVFRAGEGGYHTYRIPALIVSAKGALLAFCEGRVNGAGDSGNIDVLLRRSFDGGKTWQPLQTVADFRDDTVGNPAPVVDRGAGTILLLFTSNPGKVSERMITSGQSPRDRTVWITRSSDDGATWSKPAEITAFVKLPDWTWYATGPGNGIQLESGRLVIPCDHNTLEGDVRFSHVIYSDDHGATWKIGGIAESKTNESAVAERKDGSLILNMRSYHGRNRRAIQISKDQGATFGPLRMDEALIEPVCQASLITTQPMGKRGNGQLVFSNPASRKRERMTVRLSTDDGATWKCERVLHEGPAAYSSLAVLRDKSIGLLYERGDKDPYERITFARFPLSFLKNK